ncbi:MAG TPA: YceI family protein [Symbiobacteriaceae bacterium]|nr:YceI family protein [Symbiobacteriaceae bacterium]
MARETWVLDPAHTTLEFSVRHMMISTVKGRFSKVEGSLEAELPDLKSAVINVTVDAASIDTREAQRDAHLRSGDFLDVEQFPNLTFQSKAFEPAGDGTYKLYGDLTIHGVTRRTVWELTYEGQAKDPWGNQRAGFSAETRINRGDFGLVWNAVLETGGILVGDEVKISVQAEAIRQA